MYKYDPPMFLATHFLVNLVSCYVCAHAVNDGLDVFANRKFTLRNHIKSWQKKTNMIFPFPL